MKKSILTFVLAFVLCIGGATGCGNKTTDKVSETTDRTVKLDDLGLEYTTPDIWKKYEKTNIYPLTIASDKTLAQIRYCYITSENLEALNSKDSDVQLSSVLKNICEIVILEKSNVESDTVKKLFASYSNADKVSEQGNYDYYFLSGYTGDLSELTNTQKTEYEEVVSGTKNLKESIKTYEFDPSAIADKTMAINDYITFQTKTLEGENIDSTIFANYKLTMVNFSGTYTYPNMDESKTLQEIYTKLKDIPEVNIISAVIDTPDSVNEEVAKKAKSAAEGKYTSIVMDSILASWVTSNLEGVPTTVFVDSNGKIIGEKLNGVQTTETYMSKINELIKTIK